MSGEGRILIVGGYGIFGGRLVDLLRHEPRLTLLVAGRSLAAAERFCAARPNSAARLVPTRIDRADDEAAVLESARANLVVDASGPFQAYGARGYGLIEQCIRLGVNYLDLADGAQFVDGVAQFDAAAKAAGVYVLSGVSSFPVLTAAVVRRLSADMASVESITGGIAPSPFAGVGANVVRAIASYAGQAIAIRQSGSAVTAHAFTESRRFVIAVPGHVPLTRRRFSLVDVPDLRALPTQWPEVAQVWMGAAPAPPVLHAALRAFAWLVRLRLLPTLVWMAPAMHFVIRHVRWGEHRGGMFVEVQGRTGDGNAVARTWHLLAEGDDGPLIPCMAVEAIVRKALLGDPPPAGARAALRDVELSAYDELFTRRTIHTGVRENDGAHDAPLYARMLGSAWMRLAPEVRALHDLRSISSWSGVCSVERGRHPLAWCVARAVGFPQAGQAQPITVSLSPDGDGERWVRSIGGRAWSSLQGAGRGRSQWLVRERFGAVSVDMALVLREDRLHYVVRRWHLAGVPLPLWLGPRTTAVEAAADGRFSFDVSISHVLTGLIVRYHGWLAPTAAVLSPPPPPPSARAAARSTHRA